MNRVTLMLACTALLCVVPGCAASVNIGGSGSATAGPICPDSTRRPSARLNGALVLAAQSVPTAALVPCLRPLPAGWTFREMQAQKGRTRVVLDFGRASDSAMTVTLVRDCDVRGAREVATDQPAARRYERAHDATSGYRGERYYVFAGGCVTYRFNVKGAVGAEPVTTISRSFRLLDRNVVRQYVHDYSDGRLDLDPAQGRPR